MRTAQVNIPGNSINLNDLSILCSVGYLLPEAVVLGGYGGAVGVHRGDAR